MWRSLTLIGVLSILPAFAASASGCLDYGPVQLSGTLVRQTYAGPPDYESVTKGDAPISIFVLSLDRTLCVIDSLGRYRKEYGTREVQIKPAPDPNLLGKQVIVVGVLAPGGASDDVRLVIADAAVSARK